MPSFSLSLGLVAVFLTGVTSVCLLASANYVVNEYLDAEFDRHHPTKRERPCVCTAMQWRYVLAEYLLPVSAGLGLGLLVGQRFAAFGLVLLCMGIAYNVRPLRTKDWQYLDVLSESVNNPLRFLLGWTILLPGALPPFSILLTYWMGGAFLMGIKRYAEYRTIGNSQVAAQYRQSFRLYSEHSLLLSSFFYALLSAFFLGVFLIKYSIEFLLTFPSCALLFTWYLAIGMRADSSAQKPERLFREYGFMIWVGGWLMMLTGPSSPEGRSEESAR